MLAICYGKSEFLNDVRVSDEYRYIYTFIKQHSTRFIGFERPVSVVERPNLLQTERWSYSTS